MASDIGFGSKKFRQASGSKNFLFLKKKKQKDFYLDAGCNVAPASRAVRLLDKG